MMRKSLMTMMLLITISAFASGTKESREIIVYAAASTSDLVLEAGEIFFEKTGVKIKLNAASSGTLARQIEQGATPDIYISASLKWKDYLENKKLVKKSSSFLGNSLVVITPGNSELKPFIINSEKSLPDFKGRISIADPDHAPAGVYAVEALKNSGLWKDIENRMQPAADVRSALAVVEFGEAELGIVYKTDAAASDKVRILSVFPENTHKPIRYYCCQLSNSSEISRDFYSFLTGDSEFDSTVTALGFSR